jgi:hypothetical protein
VAPSISIHVRLRARARLPHGEREVIVQLAVNHLLRRGDNLLADLLVEKTEFHVGLCGRALDDAQRAHDRHGLLLPTDLEVGEAALRLRAPIAVGRDLDGSEAVGFGTGLGHRIVPGFMSRLLIV